MYVYACIYVCRSQRTTCNSSISMGLEALIHIIRVGRKFLHITDLSHEAECLLFSLLLILVGWENILWAKKAFP